MAHLDLGRMHESHVFILIDEEMTIISKAFQGMSIKLVLLAIHCHEGWQNFVHGSASFGQELLT